MVYEYGVKSLGIASASKRTEYQNDQQISHISKRCRFVIFVWTFLQKRQDGKADACRARTQCYLKAMKDAVPRTGVSVECYT